LVGRYLYRLTGWTLAFTWEGAVVAAGVMALPIMVKSARAALESVDARYEMVSFTLGKGELETFFRVNLPLAFRGILAGIVLSFARALGEFGATLMLAGNIPGKTQTMPLAIFEAFIAGEDRQAQALALILTFTSLVTIYFTNALTRPPKSA
jgi:molybdate transport system permease protein